MYEGKWELFPHQLILRSHYPPWTHKGKASKAHNVNNQSFNSVKCLVTSISKFQVFVKLFFSTTIAMKSWSVSVENTNAKVDEPWIVTLV